MHNPQDTAADAIAVVDPFAMLINPQAVLQAIEQSGRLGSLASRVCRPLDKPLIPKRDGDEPRSYEEALERHADLVEDTELGTMY
jgi:hypothetical protein